MAINENKIKEEITKRWDYSSQHYDTYHGHGIKSDEEAAAWTALFRQVIPGEKLNVLDVGCGTGEMSRILAEMGHKVTGIDLSEKMLTVAKSKASGSIEFRRGDAENPPFDEGKFDAVVTRHVLWTLPNPEKALKSWRNVLKSGGRVVVLDGIWDNGSFETRMRRKIGNLMIHIVEKNDISKDSYTAEMNSMLPNAKGVSLDKAREYMEKTGFKDVRSLGLDKLVKIQKKHMPFRYKISYKYEYYAIYGLK
ncbi:TPA: class I SAM-dependent methyltransferase [Methanosarcina acetivorans]|uniref:Ubiquinone/menaquinone biosynthesis methyltransferase n=2 Tax=Methanosarcina acetivorans TaxID=2214 RepID=Q8TNX5_METAC|nr:class I SAM-dependent methyltransferase [Methanosarcina acetivorans]AAM05550.1 ubiquinone/menaquinone biosynthesis methyltransferase [Methanosarcina acetivorans C2A]HIH93696.1 class I SAM-dependent methyltransferase [Methanosarcina acetivorans]